MATGIEREAKLSRSRSVASLRIRERTEELEEQDLAPYATKSANAKRAQPEEPSPTRTSYAVDRDRIVHSKAFRRTKHKTQVFLAPVGDHYRTRLTHILEDVRESRAVVVSHRREEDLRLVLRPPERLAVDDAVAVDGEARPRRRRLLRFRALRVRTLGRVRCEVLLLELLGALADAQRRDAP